MNVPKASITSPAFPSERISREDATFRDSLNKVLRRSIEGKLRSAKASGRYNPTSSNSSENEILRQSSTSSNCVGRGTTNIAIIRRTNAERSKSFIRILCILYLETPQVMLRNIGLVKAGSTKSAAN
jgi:hypothetical protein